MLLCCLFCLSFAQILSILSTDYWGWSDFAAAFFLSMHFCFVDVYHMIEHTATNWNLNAMGVSSMMSLSLGLRGFSLDWNKSTKLWRIQRNVPSSCIWYLSYLPSLKLFLFVDLLLRLYRREFCSRSLFTVPCFLLNTILSSISSTSMKEGFCGNQWWNKNNENKATSLESLPCPLSSGLHWSWSWVMVADRLGWGLLPTYNPLHWRLP